MHRLPILLALTTLAGLPACGGNHYTPGLTNPGKPPATAAVSGAVTFKGAPLAGVTVTAWSTNTNSVVATATTAADGSYTLHDIQAAANVPQVYQLWAIKTGYAFYPTVASPGQVLRFDHTGQFQGNGVTDIAIYFTVIQFTAAEGVSLANANFTAYDGSSPLVALPRTGQSVSYAEGDDASLAQGAPWPAIRFRDNHDGTVTDALTGLVWLQDAGCLPPALWAGSLGEANQLATGQCGLSDNSKAGDWRLPNLAELESLIDASQANPALPAGHPFTSVSNAIYWTSTSYFGGQAGSPAAWAIRLGDGRYMNDAGINLKTVNTNFVWAVRGAGAGGALKLPATGFYVPFSPGDDGTLQTGVPATWPRFVDNNNGTVTDTVTGLVWLKQANCLHDSWANAVAAVRALATGQCGLTDNSRPGAWRMPNRAEMQSLQDRAENNLGAFFNQTYRNRDGGLFQPPIFADMVAYQFYWTSTTNAANPAEAWTVFSCDFGLYDIPKENLGYTLAVR
ncbi:DUF1566 domain-containing protein [Acidobacteria bacterium AB60]|nr:DUF1566 domain-containing protein [Acidobacteria bacterium AB60]